MSSSPRNICFIFCSDENTKPIPAYSRGKINSAKTNYVITSVKVILIAEKINVKHYIYIFGYKSRFKKKGKILISLAIPGLLLVVILTILVILEY